MRTGHNLSAYLAPRTKKVHVTTEIDGIVIEAVAECSGSRLDFELEYINFIATPEVSRATMEDLMTAVEPIISEKYFNR